MAKFNAIKRRTVTEQVMEQIAHLITSGQVESGEKLPNERDLAEKLQVTRNRIREAIRALSLIGLVKIKPGEGIFVNERETFLPGETITWLFHNEISNLREVYEARRLIETEIYLKAYDNMTSENLVKLDAILESAKISISKGNNEEFLDILDSYDLLISEISQNQIYNKLMQTLVHLRRDSSLKLFNIPESISTAIKTRSAILKAFKLKDYKNLTQELDNFFDELKNSVKIIGED